jgi:hypothetical protein
MRNLLQSRNFRGPDHLAAKIIRQLRSKRIGCIVVGPETQMSIGASWKKNCIPAKRFGISLLPSG